MFTQNKLPNISAKDNDLNLPIGTVIAFTLLLNGAKELGRNFLGYVTENERKNETVMIEMMVSAEYEHELSRAVQLEMNAKCCAQKLVENIDAISTAIMSRLVKGDVMNPWMVS